MSIVARKCALSMLITLMVCSTVYFAPPGSAPVMAPSTASAATGHTTYAPDTLRIAGANRLATSVEVSKHGWESSDWVVIATANSFPDGLVGVGLAGALGAPVLLSQPSGLASETVTEIERLGATNAILLGGEAALSAQVVADLESTGMDPTAIERIGGSDRYDTARNVAERMGVLLGGARTVIVATGENWPDALAISGWAGSQGFPILLSRQGEIPTSTASAIASIRPERAIVMGGESAIGEDVFLRLPNAFRIEGHDRYETAMNAAEHSFVFGHEFDTVYMATGMDYPDALSAGALAAKTHSTLILTRPDSLAYGAEDYLLSHCSSIDELGFLGGTSAISTATAQAAVEAASVIVHEDFTELTPAAESALETMTPAGILVFDDSADAADYIMLGDILAGDPDALDGGLLVRVSGISETGGKRLLNTQPANVNEVLVKGSTTHVVPVMPDGETVPTTSDMLALSSPPTEPTVATPASAVDRSSLAGWWWDGRWHAGGTLGTTYSWPFHESWDTSGTYGELDITVDATLTIAGYMTLNTNWQWAELREFDITFTASEYFDSKLLGTYDLDETKRWPIGNKEGYVIEEVDLEVVPDVIVIPVELRAKPYFELEGKVHAEVKTGMSNWVWVQWGTWWTAEYGWGHNFSHQTGVSYIPPSVDATATVRADIGCTIEVSVGTLGGPYIEPEGYLEFDAEEHWVLGKKGALDWQLWGGADYRWGGEIDVLGYKQEWDGDRQSIYRRQLTSGHIDF